MEEAGLNMDWNALAGMTQGGSCLATLGFVAESLWNSPNKAEPDPCLNPLKRLSCLTDLFSAIRLDE